MSSLPLAPTGFLDAVGGLPMAAAVAQAYARASELAWADPLRLHHLGRQSALFLSTARASIATAVADATGATISAEQIFFAPNMRMASHWAAAGCMGTQRCAATAIENLALVDGLTDHDPDLAILPVDRHGFLVQAGLADLGPAPSVLVAVQAANGEIGTRQDLSRAAAHGYRLIVDASHSLGRIDLGRDWSILLLSVTDLGGPAGLVIMAVQPQARWTSPLPSSGGWIGGRADVPAVVAAATALELTLPVAKAQAASQFALIERLRTSIERAISDVTFAGDQVQRLPHILNCSILYLSGEAL
ncbi:MAG: hypothetical protein Q8L05_03340, partial [Actinomycetota bacterium]|nr:hypothetical protein [Actinomycetota bacterium]